MKKQLPTQRIDKKYLSTVTLFEEPDDKLYWLSKGPIERLKKMEELRRINYGNSATSRLQREFEYTKR